MIFDGPIALRGNGTLVPGAAVRHDLAQHRATFGGLRHLTALQLLDEVERIGLTGRGGGHFPVARKLRPVVESCATTVVVNASEGELLSSKDAMLLQLRPHLVLDGAQALARAVRAHRIVVWLHEGADASVRSIIAACEQRERDPEHAGDVRVQVMAGPARYLTGEASAVINGVRGKDVLPSFVLDPAQPWVDGEPVLVHNAETHARVGLLDRDGVEYQPTSLVTLALHDRRVVLEATATDTFASVFAAHGIPAPAALLLGGFGGQWVAWTQVGQLPIDPLLLRERGISLGAGIIAVIPPTTTGPLWSVEILEWMAGESAGQCGPCVYGLPELARQYRHLVESRRVSRRKVQRVRELMHDVEQRGACRHPDGAVRMARSAMQVFGIAEAS